MSNELNRLLEIQPEAITTTEPAGQEGPGMQLPVIRPDMSSLELEACVNTMSQVGLTSSEIREKLIAGGVSRLASAKAVERLAPGDPHLAGIGGWLILPAIGLVLSGIISVVGLVASLALFSDVADAGYGGLYSVEIVVHLSLLVFLIYAATRFFGKRRNAPSMMIGLMIASVVASGLLLMIELSAGADEFAIESGKALTQGVIGATIWIPYFVVSERVKATFVN